MNPDMFATSCFLKVFFTGICREHFAHSMAVFTCFYCEDTSDTSIVHPGRLTWTIMMEVWKIIFLSKWVICRFQPLIFQGVFFYPLQIASPSVINPKSYWEGSASVIPEALTSSNDIRHEANFLPVVGFRKGSGEWKIHR